MTKYMDHNLYKAGLKNRTKDSLLYALNDAQEAIRAQPDGVNAGFYADEVHYLAAELKIRRDRESR